MPRLSCGAEGPAHYFGDRQRGFAILIAACLDSPTRLSLTFGTADGESCVLLGCALRPHAGSDGLLRAAEAIRLAPNRHEANSSVERLEARVAHLVFEMPFLCSVLNAL